MKNKITAFALVAFFFAGSILLPLSDFSLMTDLPVMYRNYIKVADPNEAGVVDFIGDYLLNGKTLLGHNKHDLTGKSGSDIHYQHTASFSSYFRFVSFFPALIIGEYYQKYPVINPPFSTSEFHDEFFRPPLVVIG